MWEEHTHRHPDKIELVRVKVGTDSQIMREFGVESVPSIFQLEGTWNPRSVVRQIEGFSEPRLLEFIAQLVK